jgi:hypothetical protein
MPCMNSISGGCVERDSIGIDAAGGAGVGVATGTGACGGALLHAATNAVAAMVRRDRRRIMRER